MGDTADVRGYYAALGLTPSSSIAAVKEAFRRLAKECHPDRSHVTDGGARFRAISEAHETLSDVQLKAEYDSYEPTDARSEAPTQHPQMVEPICCDVCGKVTAQPRRLAFWRVTSFVLASRKIPVQKIYCRSCALREQWTSTIWTGVLGWWGVPWGPIWSTAHGISNVLGGTRETKVDEGLMWQNAVAFASSGQGPLAVGLSNILRRSDDPELAERSAALIQFFADRGVDASTTFKDVWKRSIFQTVTLFALLFVVPGSALAWIFSPSEFPSQSVSTSSGSSEDFSAAGTANSTVDETFDQTFGPNAVASEPASVPIPVCTTPPSNGTILVDHRSKIAKGHVLKIDNGSRGDAIIKLRDAASDMTVASFFVQSGQTAALSRIPDGTYRVQYAFGGELKADCESFVEIASAGEFPEAETLITEYRDLFDSREVSWSELSYTLYDVPGGNVHPEAIDAAEFNKP